MSELFDIHSHAGEQRHNLYNEPEIYPRKLTVERLLEEYGDRIEKIVACPMPGTIFFNYDNGEVITGSKENGRYPYDLENHAMVEEVDKHDGRGRILPFLCIHPRIMVSEQLDGIADIMQNNRMVGIKFHTLDTNSGLNSFFGNNEITSFCRQMNLPVLIHSANFNNVENCNDIFHWSQLNPDIRVCIAHLMNFSSVFFDRLSKHELGNIYTDISPFLGLCKMAERLKKQMNCLNMPFNDPEEVFSLLFEHYGRHVLWGSDEPFGKFKLAGNEYVQYSLDDELKFLFSLDKNTRIQIASVNSKRFVGKPE